MIAAVPGGSTLMCKSLRDVVDEVIGPERREPFLAVGVWYEDFSPTSDAEVKELLRRAAERQGARETIDPVRGGAMPS
jgi:putative phosphoribosyl transferase